MTACPILCLVPPGWPPPAPAGAAVTIVPDIEAAIAHLAATPASLLLVGGPDAAAVTGQMLQTAAARGITLPVVVTDGAAAATAAARAARFADFAEVASDRLWETDATDRIAAVFGSDGTPLGDDPVLHCGADLGAVLADAAARPSMTAPAGTAPAGTTAAEAAADPGGHAPFRDVVARHAATDDQAVIYRLSGKPVTDAAGRHAGYRGAATDITAEVHDQRAAQRSRIRLYEAVENMPAAFMLFDADDRLVLWNTLAHAIYPNARHRMVAGVTFEDLIRAAAENGDIGDAAVEPARETWIRTRLAQHRKTGIEVERLAPDGRWLRDTEHRTSFGGTVCVISDITELKAREADLRAAMVTAEQANEAKSKFLAAASHDLRQPVHAFGLLVTGLAHRAKTPDIARIAARMDQALENLQDMLNALLDMSRLDAGVLKAETGTVDLLRMFERIDSDFQPIAQDKGLRLVVRPHDAVVLSDPMLLDRILRNLVSNGLRYTGEGGVLLGVRRRRMPDGQPGLRIECWDTGIGIPAEKQQEIFNEFHRLDEPVRDSRKGLGLGLSIVDRFARLLNTGISLRSRYGRGSVFAIQVPLAGREPVAAIAADGATPGGRPLRGRSIVLIDDDPLALESLTTLIEDWGGRVVAGESAEEVLTLLDDRGAAADLMLVDFNLGGGVAGPWAVSAVRARIGAPVPALLVTGLTDPPSLDMVQATGLPWVTKPVPAATVLVEIERLIGP